MGILGGEEQAEQEQRHRGEINAPRLGGGQRGGDEAAGAGRVPLGRSRVIISWPSDMTLCRRS